MESITSTFFGLLFPHSIEVDSQSGKAYFLLYEVYTAHYSVKTIVEQKVLEEALKAYNEEWAIDTVKNHQKPLTLVANGTMKQLAINLTFLGTSVEEKFHLSAFSLAIIPCIPLVSIRLKNMVHPDIAPIQLEEGVKEGYFMVNLSMSQNFDVESEFFAMPDYQNDITGQGDDLDSELDIQSHHEDDEELESPVSPRPRPVRETTLARNQQDLDAEEMLDYEADILAGIDRFSDSSSDSEHGHGNLVDGNDSDNDSNTSLFFYTRQSQNVNSCIQQRKDY
ncbi:hypothetical protein RO3G_16697 [Rhizopus delemar RA 99-880]|uniref:Uncharacterized protein n=1 Tax=Rhizopus delemar (strain RA 99-880 / ATCC MYA-4621 / FGSC 9543 / NRRL 43880) TaxID=246409 RepID=I1CU56_RHIO9|nr:hypothetical protein RO3G_16697 [Rhizopus delemar RA 99-880]|eukprot:EIE91986.1 hypothetical protein RO3G_16697 [Rhizopus delemar RA 99-880]